jgi:hypothetical protein
MATGIRRGPRYVSRIWGDRRRRWRQLGLTTSYGRQPPLRELHLGGDRPEAAQSEPLRVYQVRLRQCQAAAQVAPYVMSPAASCGLSHQGTAGG